MLNENDYTLFAIEIGELSLFNVNDYLEGIFREHSPTNRNFLSDLRKPVFLIHRDHKTEIDPNKYQIALNWIERKQTEQVKDLFVRMNPTMVFNDSLESIIHNHFNKARTNELIIPQNQFKRQELLNLHTFQFNKWLKKEKESEDLSESSYKKLATYEAFKEYLKHYYQEERTKEQKRKRQIKEEKKEVGILEPTGNGTTNKITVRQFALYYRYIQESKEYPAFGSNGRTITNDYEDIAKKYGISTKNFQILFNSTLKKESRTASNNYKNIKAAIALLKDFPKALEIANKELILAQLNT